MTTTLLSLPNEILLEIIASHPALKDFTETPPWDPAQAFRLLLPLAFTNRRLNTLVTPTLDRLLAIASKPRYRIHPTSRGFHGVENYKIPETYRDPVRKHNLTIPADITILQHVVIHRDQTFLGRLLKAGADPNENAFAITPLSIAALENQLEMTRLLLENGAEPNGKADTTDPIHYAAESRNSFAVVLLLDHGADVDSQHCPTAQTVLNMAAQCPDLGMTNILLRRGANVSLIDTSGMTALHKAALSGSTAVARVLLKHGASVNTCDQTGRTALFHAAMARQPNTSLIELLLENGADVNMRDVYGSTPLVRCILGDPTASLERSQVEDASVASAVRVLLAAGADVNYAGYRGGSTALNLAVQTGSHFGVGLLRTIRTLLEAGATVDVKNATTGDTPLHEAMVNGSFNIAEVLLEFGANRRVKNHDGKTPGGSSRYWVFKVLPLSGRACKLGWNATTMTYSRCQKAKYLQGTQYCECGSCMKKKAKLDT